MSKVAIGIAHGHAAKWLQTSIYSLQRTKNKTKADIYVAHTWPGYPSIKGITETPLGEGVTVFDCKLRRQSHATGLDEILDLIADRDYDYFFAMEDDCMAVKDGWLDWYVNFLEADPKIGMAGFFWIEGNNHYNINPSATLYRKDMLLQYHKEVRENNEGMFWHPRGNRSETDGGMDSNIKDVAGVFSETRGLKNPSPQQKEEILKGVPQAAWFEPGAWLYYRSIGDYHSVRVPVEHVYMQYKGGRAPEGTYYGSKAEPCMIHWWGGTRTWDHLKHPVTDRFVGGCSPQWIDREHSIWMQVVPVEYRMKMDEIHKEMGITGMGYDQNFK